jgi:hypothetical protein
VSKVLLVPTVLLILTITKLSLHPYVFYKLPQATLYSYEFYQIDNKKISLIIFKQSQKFHMTSELQVPDSTDLIATVQHHKFLHLC